MRNSLGFGKAALLRKLLDQPGLVRVAGAHNGLTARLVERTGFDAVWASGFEICTSYAIPDASILTMTELLGATRSMNDVVDLPVIADCDTGFGDINNVAHMVRQYESAGIAAVCIEDKQFPKLNSFAGGDQHLASIDEFAGKIAVSKETQESDDFIVIARLEAFIVGRGCDEALRRAHAYVDAGADAILVHSKSRTPLEVFSFVERWECRRPLVVVPTTYFQTTAVDFERAGVKVVIYANQGIRAAARHVEAVLGDIYRCGTSEPVEERIATVRDLFELQGMGSIRSRGR